MPAGASSRTDRVNGPGTPRYDDIEPAFREAIDEIENGRDARRPNASLRYILDHARQRDAMTLWRLIPRVGAADRAGVVDALSARVPMPPTCLATRSCGSTENPWINGGTRSESTLG